MSAPATTPPVVSVVMPAYNEAEHIEACVTEWHDAVIAALPGSEIIVIDDCSRDQTFALLQQMATRLPALRVLQTPTNLGHGPALRLALEACRGDFIFQTDSDRQHTPDDFWAFWQRRQDADLLVGVRTTRADGTFRRIVSSVMRALNLAIWQTWLPDANCPFKLMRRRVLAVVLPAIPRTSFIPMVMLSMLAGRAGFTVVSLPVHHFPRRAGEQSLAGVMRWARVGTRCAIELVRLRFAAPPSRRSAKPARSVSS
jgi:dolichol-phosphate mannosyltransferase